MEIKWAKPILFFESNHLTMHIRILLKLTNHSPTIDQIILVGIEILGWLLFKQQQDIGKLEGNFDNFKDNCNKEFC